MITETTRPPQAPVRSSIVAVAATSTARFRCVLAALGLGADAGAARSVLIVGIVKLGMLERWFAPTTGLITVEATEAAAVRDASRAASEAASSLSIGVVARHCACTGWRDARLRRALSAHHCQSLFVHASDMPAWRRRRLRRQLAEVGVSLVVVDAESTGRQTTNDRGDAP